MGRAKTNKVCWVGPFRLRDYLEMAADPKQVRPPEYKGVYILSQRPWVGVPTKDDSILYVGGNTTEWGYFRRRVGDLVADVLGFFNKEFGHNPGGQSAWRFCRRNHLKPLDLYLGWVEGVHCPMCAEKEVYEKLGSALGRRAPPRCKIHTPPLLACFELR
jgi:hypothetical protein